MKRSFNCLLIAALLIAMKAPADVLPEVVFEPVELQVTDIGHGWRKWEGIPSDREVSIGYSSPPPDLISALSIDGAGSAWAGTSRGTLVILRPDGHTAKGRLGSVQITDFAFETPERVWLSTADGLVRLSRNEPNRWKTEHYRYYLEGHPTAVSGLYDPGLDSRRPWGYVDHVYFPQAIRHYAPFAVSSEHGLFCEGKPWHHFMPHYWGWNSPWLDTRDLMPHRRPTCMAEDGLGNLWIGTEWDGVVRLNAHARKYCERRSDNNQKDGTEFSFFGPAEIGTELFRVMALVPSTDPRTVWALIQSKARRFDRRQFAGDYLARFDGEKWAVLSLAGKADGASCLTEFGPAHVLIGSSQGVFEVNWQAQSVRMMPGLARVIRETRFSVPIWKIQVSPDGRVFAASPFELYELPERE